MMLTDLIKHILIGWQSNYLFPFSLFLKWKEGFLYPTIFKYL